MIFNNMLTAAIGNNELLAGRLSGDDIATSLLSDASRAAESGAKLTGQLLSSALQQPLDSKAIDLIELVHGFAKQPGGLGLGFRRNFFNCCYLEAPGPRNCFCYSLNCTRTANSLLVARI